MTGRFLRSLYVGRMTEYLSGPGVSDEGSLRCEKRRLWTAPASERERANSCDLGSWMTRQLTPP